VFSKTARYYDQLYSFKNYAAEAAQIRGLIRREHPGAHSILDVACGTAEHAKLLSSDFAVDGIDLEPEFVEIARSKVPAGSFHVADMRQFDLGKKYDVVQCLFSSIGYLTDGSDVVRALGCFARHLAPGGIIIVEPWITPENWKHTGPSMLSVDQPDLKIARVNVNRLEGNLTIIPFDYLIATRTSVEHVQEEHVLALYTVDEMLQFFERARLKVKYDPQGLDGRGLYVAVPQ
jgi:SAM-dependent methyltransferase